MPLIKKQQTVEAYTLSAKKLSKFQKYENTKSFKITNFIEKIALQYTFYWFFLWYHRL